MSDSKKQKKNSGDAIKQRGLHPFAPAMTAEVYHCARPASCFPKPCLNAVLPFHRVQFRQTEDSWRLDRSYRRGNCRDISCLVDASDVRTLNALKPLLRGSIAEMRILRQVPTCVCTEAIW